MRTTITFEDDVAAAVERARRERSIGVSEAVNDLIRAGLVAKGLPSKPFIQEVHDMGPLIDVSNVAEALDLLDS